MTSPDDGSVAMFFLYMVNPHCEAWTALARRAIAAASNTVATPCEYRDFILASLHDSMRLYPAVSKPTWTRVRSLGSSAHLPSSARWPFFSLSLNALYGA